LGEAPGILQCFNKKESFMKSDRESFPEEVARQLRTYVYRLIDPRNGETFYIGKGKGNRVFSHINAEKGLEGDELDSELPPP
jgi:hypothetical protein